MSESTTANNYSLIYLLEMVALLAAITMIAVARKGFNGFAVGFISFGLMLIVRRIDDVTGIIGEPGMAVISSLVVALYCYQAWSVWKDRHDHAEYLNWREQWSKELKLIREYQERMQERAERERELERQRIESGEQLSSWEHQDEIARQTRQVNAGLKQ
jgi:hypothetical protein